MCLIGLYLGTKYEVCRWNSLRDMTSSLIFTPFGNILPWPLTLTKNQGHQRLGHWMRLIGLYLGTKYEVCRWNSLQVMTSSLILYPFWENLTLTFDLDLRSVIGTWVIECASLGCTLVPGMKSVVEIASEIWPILCFFLPILRENLTLTFHLESRSSALGSLNVPYWVVPWYQVWSL